MALAKIKGAALLQFPYTYDDLRSDNPFTAFGHGDLQALFAATEAGERGESLVEPVATEPLYDPATEYAIEGEPIYTNNEWRQSWVIHPRPPPSDEEIKAQIQAALDASDRTLLRCLERGLAVPQAWAEYRQALRLVLADTTLPFPERPAYP